jgi:hypothetical protein
MGRDRRVLAMAGMVAGLLAAGGAARGAELQVTALAPPRHTMAPRTTAVSITFDRAVLPGSVTAATFRVFGHSSGAASGTFALSNGDQTVTLAPIRPFAAGEVVSVNLSHDLVAADGSPLRSAGYAYQFTVATAPATRSFQQLDVVSNRSNPGVQTRIYGALAADLDGDGFVDLATVNEVSADVRVTLNRADGSGLFHAFLPPHPIGIEASPNESADFDNDGNVDMAISATDSTSVWILLGDGDGTFGSTQEIAVSGEPHGITTLDVDGDGDMDVVNANYGGNQLALLINNGNGVFGPATFFDGGVDGEYGIAAGDMNADGITDLVVAGNNAAEIRVLLGNGNGTFTPAPAQSSGGATWVVVLGDVDGDGNLDAVAANSFDGNGGILLGNGDGTLGPPALAMTNAHTPSADLGDLDGDGDLDLVLSSFGGGFWRIFTNDGSGNFSFDQQIDAPSNPSCSILLDFDNDGDLDMALTDEIADVIVLEQNSNVVAPACPAAPAGCHAPDASGRALLQFKDKSTDAAHRLVWKWLAGSATKAEFGNPLATESYRLCIYDGGTLVSSARMDAGGTCHGGACWKETALGYTFKDRDLTPDGAYQLVLKEGPTGGAKITFKGRGVNLQMPDLAALTGPVAVRLHTSSGSVCWGATYSAPFQHQDATAFKDHAD